MAMPTVIAKNQTGSDIDLDRLGLRVPASGQITLAGTADSPATYTECTEDETLEAAVTSGDIVINDGAADLSTAAALGYLDSSGNLDGPVTGAATNALVKLSDTTGRRTAVTGVSVDGSNNVTTAGTIDASGVLLGGTAFAHTDLLASSLVWTASDHTGTANRIPSFNGSGVAAEVQVGVDLQAWDTDLDALAGLGSTGIIVRSGAGTAVTRSLVAPAAGITIADAGGVSGNPTFALANDLLALEGLGTTGFAVRTGTDTWAQRVLTGTTNHITITNGSGVSGNPTFDVGANVILTTTSLGGDLSGNLPNPTVTDLTMTGELEWSTLYFDGTNWVSRRNRYTTVNPSAGDDGTQLFRVGSYWGNTSTQVEWVCLDDSTGAAVWVEVVNATSTQTLTNKTLTSPTIGDFTNAVHDHEAAAGGGQLSHALSLTVGTLVWGSSGHTGTANTFAAFTAGGAATNLTTSASGDVAGTWPSLTVTDLTITGEVQGSVLYFNGTNWVSLGPGTAGELFTTAGPGANPSWVEPSTDLQTAYDNGNTIVTASTTPILFTLTSGGFTVNGAGDVNIGADANTGAINVGTGAAARTITVGNTTGATQLDLAAGTGHTNTTTGMAWSGSISPTSLGADQDDYTPTGVGIASVIRQDASVDVSITGVSGGTSGRILVITNIGVNIITLPSEDVGSTAANRFLFGAPFIRMFPNDSVILQYDSTSSRWRAPATSKGTVAGEVKTLFTQFGSNSSTALGAHNTLQVGSNGSLNLEARIPQDFNALISLAAIMVPGSTNAAANIDLTSTYAAVGELYDLNTESNTTITFNVTNNTIAAIEASSVATGVSAGDFIGIEFDHKSTGGSSNYIGMVLTYT